MSNNKIKTAFAEWSPCIYEGARVCDGCPRLNDDPDESCDMAAGRIHRQKTFEAGAEWAEAAGKKEGFLSRMQPAVVSTFSPAEVIHDGKRYVPVREVPGVASGCTGCAFDSNGMDKQCRESPCIAPKRPDGKNVIWKEAT